MQNYLKPRKAECYKTEDLPNNDTSRRFVWVARPGLKPYQMRQSYGYLKTGY